MSTEFNELLHNFGDDTPQDDRVQILIIGSREQVQHNINEFYVKRIATDRVQFTPIFPAPFFPGKYMSVLVR